MDILKLNYPDPAERLCALLTLGNRENASLEVGTAYLKAGTRMPDRGVSAHPRHEISIILEGEIETTSNGRTVVLGAGDIVSIPAFEPQSSIIRQDTRLIYLFFGNQHQ
jgi:quercetin dioxygenase-like cupin family protein